MGSKTKNRVDRTNPRGYLYLSKSRNGREEVTLNRRIFLFPRTKVLDTEKNGKEIQKLVTELSHYEIIYVSLLF